MIVLCLEQFYICFLGMEGEGKGWRCRICQAEGDVVEGMVIYENQRYLRQHQVRKHNLYGRGRNAEKIRRPFLEENAPWNTIENRNTQFREGFSECYADNDAVILAGDEVGKIKADYNVAFDENGFSLQKLLDRLKDIVLTTGKCMKVILQPGTILYNVQSSQFRYFAPHINEVLTEPVVITKMEDVEKLRKLLEDKDIESHVLMNRPNTKHIPIFISNVLITCFFMDYPMGRGGADMKLPYYLKDSKSVCCLDKDRHGRFYDDNLCFFRCLARQREGKVLQSTVVEMYQKWVRYTENHKVKPLLTDVSEYEFEGIELRHVPHLEKCFQVNIEIYHMLVSGEVEVFFKSVKSFKETLYLNEYDAHLSLITKFSSYSKTYVCKMCWKIFSSSYGKERHTRACKKYERSAFKGGAYCPPRSIFSRMSDFGVNVPEDLKYLTDFCTFDLESLLISKDRAISDNTKLRDVHQPVSFSVCSTLEGYTEPICVVEEDPKILTEKFLVLLNEIQTKFETKMQQLYAPYLQKINEMCEFWKPEKVVKKKRKERKRKLKERSWHWSTRQQYNTYEDIMDNSIVQSELRCEEEEEGEEISDMGDECIESNVCEAPSAEFIEAMKRKNPWRVFLDNLERGDWNIQYNYDRDSSQTGIGHGNCAFVQGHAGALPGNVGANENVNSDHVVTSEQHANCAFVQGQDGALAGNVGTNENTNSDHVVTVQFPAHVVANQSEDDVCQSEAVTRGPVYTFDTVRDGDLRPPASLLKHHRTTYNQLCQIRNDLTRFMKQLCILGYNSSSYDIPLISPYLFSSLGSKKVSIIKRAGRYSMVASETLKFIDAMQFTPPGSSYSSFVECFTGLKQGEGKLFFPYEALKNYHSLIEIKALPSVDDSVWYSTLKKRSVLDDPSTGRSIQENWDIMDKLWKEKGMTCLKDLLIEYNNSDTLYFVHAVSRMIKHYREANQYCVLSRSVSTPGLVRNIAFEEANKKGCHFALPNRKNKDLQQMLLTGIVGGPSLVIKRKVEKNVTPIRPENPEILAKSVFGFDYTSLYSFCLSQNQPSGSPIIRKKENNFAPQGIDKYQLERVYLQYLSDKLGVPITTKRNGGWVPRIGALLPDGIMQPQGGSDRSVVVEFAGCWHHHHVCRETENVSDPKWWAIANSETDEFEEKKKYYDAMGYDTKLIRSCELDDILESDPIFRQYLEKKQPKFYQKYTGAVTQEQLINAIKSGEFYGIVKCSLRLPSALPVAFANQECTVRELYSDFPPIFLNTMVPKENWSQEMVDYAKKENMSLTPRKLLISVLECNNTVFSSELLQYYVNYLGYQIRDITEVVEYQPSLPFTDFIEERVRKRMEGSRDPSKSLQTTLAKFECNSLYGTILTNPQKFTKTSIIKGHKEATKAINNKNFLRLYNINAEEDVYEVNTLKHKTVYKYPTVVGFWVLQRAKKRLLEMWYNFFLKFVDRKYLIPCVCDTDSIYISFASETFEECIRPEMKPYFNHLREGFCSKKGGPRVLDISGGEHFMGRTCCREDMERDRFQPGVLHEEMAGDSIFALSSKTYFCEKSEKNPQTQKEEIVKTKSSAKGVNKGQISKDGAQYKDVLQNKNSIRTENMGFIKKYTDSGSNIYTYATSKNSFNWFYIKRKLNPLDHNSTIPLDIVPEPVQVEL